MNAPWSPIGATCFHNSLNGKATCYHTVTSGKQEDFTVLLFLRQYPTPAVAVQSGKVRLQANVTVRLSCMLQLRTCASRRVKREINTGGIANPAFEFR